MIYGARLIVCDNPTTRKLHCIIVLWMSSNFGLSQLPDSFIQRNWSIMFEPSPTCGTLLDSWKSFYLGKYHQKHLNPANSRLLYMQDCKTFSRKTNLSIVCSAVGWTSCFAVVHMPKLKSYCRGNDTVCSLVTGYCWQQGWKTEIFTVNGPRWSILSQSCTK